MTEKILTAIKEVKEKSKKRNVNQSFDLIINLKHLDTKKAESRINEVFTLPNSRGKDSTIALFSDTIKDADCEILKSSDIEKLAADKRAVKNFAKKIDFSLSEPKLMPVVGKALGQFLAPRGKMPKIVVGNVNSMIKNYKKSIRIKVKDSPVIHCSIGSEKLEDEKIAENINAVLDFLLTKLPKGKQNIRSVFIKLTMGKPVKIEV